MSLPIREVVLELLRHGEAHNQLLSPLTQYLALCGSRPAVSLQIPWEHRDLEYWLSRMNYDPSAMAADCRDRAVVHRQLADMVTTLLEQVPGLASEGRVSEGQMLHLRLMLTPQELALLPFELANAPSGFASGQQPLLLGPRPDVVLTREVRRSESVRVKVPPQPKILLVVGEGTVPFEPTRDAILRALEPWIGPVNDKGTVKHDLASHLHILHAATLDEVREACATGEFTHVHILAHGAPLPESEQKGFGLALWNRAKDDQEVVSGASLALALRPPGDDGSYARPWSVVLCTCDSGNVGGVIHPTANIAHALHIEGIPMVIASQYPLTFGAAVELAGTFYRLELRGEDPRRTVRDVRHAIATRMRGTHDWASLVVYAGWPDDVQGQLDEIRLVRLFAQLEAASGWADTAIEAYEELNRPRSARKSRASKGAKASKGKEPPQELPQVLSRSIKAIERVAELLEREAHRCERKRDEIAGRRERSEISKHERAHLLGNVTALLTEIYGLLGSAAKRKARLLTATGSDAHAKIAIRDAGSWYLKGVALKAPEHWTACQSFVMLGLGQKMGWASEEDLKRAREQWVAAKETAERVLKDANATVDPGTAVWAHSTLIEVAIWGPFFAATEEPTDLTNEEEAVRKATHHLDQVRKMAESDPFPLHSTTRQLERYRSWWGPKKYVDEGVLQRAEHVLGTVGDADRAESPPTNFEMLEYAIEETEIAAVLGTGKTTPVFKDQADDESTFLVRMLPARQGDALWIEYGKEGDRHRILIDGGFRRTLDAVRPTIEEIAETSPTKRCEFALGVVSHIDADHIEGFIELLAGKYPVSFGDMWFNGRRHLESEALVKFDPAETLAGKHGLFLDQVLDLGRTPWNQAFEREAVVVPSGDAPLPCIELPGDMWLTLFSPTPAKLRDLARRWDREVRKAGLDGASFDQIRAAMDRLHYSTEGLMDRTLRREKPVGTPDIAELLKVADGVDESPANGSSIAFLAEFEGRSCFFMADAHPDALIESIDRHVGKDGRLSVGAVKLSHHGSGNNVTDALLRRIDSSVFLISTSGGGGHYHPDREAIARLIAGSWREEREQKIHLLFNYKSPFTTVWDDQEWKDRYNYEVYYADSGDILELSAVPRAAAADD